MGILEGPVIRRCFDKKHFPEDDVTQSIRNKKDCLAFAGQSF